MKNLCKGCELGFRSPEFHLPPTPIEQAEWMWALTKTYKHKEDVEEGYSEGLLTGKEKDFLLSHIGGA